MNQNEVARMSDYYIRNAQKYSSYDTELGIILKKLAELCEKGDCINLGKWSIIFTNVLLAWISEEDENA